MSNEATGTQPSKELDPEFKESGSTPQPELPKPKLRVFRRSDTVRSVWVKLALPDLYPGYEPWTFELGLKLTEQAEERRQEYLALTPTEFTVRAAEQNLDELCDLLRSMPQGFGDLQDNGQGPGPSFMDYVKTADTGTKDMLMAIVQGAITLYWRKISPQEFRKSL